MIAHICDHCGKLIKNDTKEAIYGVIDLRVGIPKSHMLSHLGFNTTIKTFCNKDCLGLYIAGTEIQASHQELENLRGEIINSQDYPPILYRDK